MPRDQRDIRRKLRVLRHVEENGSVVRTCRNFGIGRASFYRWKTACKNKGEAGPRQNTVLVDRVVEHGPPQHKRLALSTNALKSVALIAVLD
jgi:transposase-like protein